MNACLRFFVLILFASSILAFPQQTPRIGTKDTEKRSQTAENKPETEDPLGRSTPHGTVFGFLQAVHSGKNEEATQYLQLSRQQRAKKGEELVHELQVLMDKAFVGRVGGISHQREGSIQPDVPEDHERIGSFKVNGSETEVDLVRVTDPSGAEIWLFSSQVLAQVPELYKEIGDTGLESRLPAVLVNTQVLSTPLWQIVALVLLLPVCFGLAWVIVWLLRVLMRIWVRHEHPDLVEDIRSSFAGPATLIFTAIFNDIGAYLLGSPLLIREYYRIATVLLLVVGLAWLVVRVINRWGERARLRSLAGTGYRNGSLILLGQRIFNVFVLIVGTLIILAILGVNVTAAVAGLGIGSIAIAFAAQKTLENLLGGISILGDQVIRVGEMCRVGEDIGRVEDISLRSTRIRTLAGTLLSVPNGQLANMNLENISRRKKTLFEAKFGLRSQTSPEQLRSVLEQIRAVLLAHPKVDPDLARVHFIEFGEYSLEIEIECLIRTGSRAEFLAIREGLLLQIMELIAAARLEFATPARILHMADAQQPEDQRVAAAPTLIRPRAHG
ncbi:MAG TPA: mechanosensitive ion channel family protein, partial [Terriglobales bacterium]